MTQYQILFWHDIPLQVRSREGRERASQALPARFQEAVDAAATMAGLTSDDDYTEGLHWDEPRERPGSPPEVAAAVAAELDTHYLAIDWRKTAAALKVGD